MAATQLAKITPTKAPHPVGSPLTKRQKAAIIVRYLMNQGAEVPLNDLPEELQAQLTTQMGAMRYVDRTTLAEVLAEFASEIEAMGLTFPRGMAGALSALDGQISPQTAARLRKQAGVRQLGDPWALVCAAPADQLIPILQAESTEVAAILLSKLDVSQAAAILEKLPGQTARRITYAISQTSDATPDVVDRIGLSLSAQLQNVPELAFDTGPVERVGAILNFSQAAIRDDVLTGLEETDETFAKQVRQAIFTFANIPDRLAPLDVVALTREVNRNALLQALAAALGGEDDLKRAGDFLLDNMSKRMAEALREEVDDLGTIPEKDGEAAMTDVVNTIRVLEAKGEITLILPEDPDS